MSEKKFSGDGETYIDDNAIELSGRQNIFAVVTLGRVRLSYRDGSVVELFDPVSVRPGFRDVGISVSLSGEAREKYSRELPENPRTVVWDSMYVEKDSELYRHVAFKVENEEEHWGMLVLHDLEKVEVVPDVSREDSLNILAALAIDEAGAVD
jgi:hypothetical protein